MIASTTSSIPSAGGGARLADEILAAVVFGAQDFLNRADWEPVLDAWLERLGRATGSHRVRVFRNLEPAADGGLRTRITAEWRAPEVADLAAMRLEELTYSQCGCDRWPAVLAKGEQIVGSTADFAECEREFLRAQGIESVAIVPVFVRAEWWGFMAFGDCVSARDWSEPVLQALSAAAGILGAALARGEMEQRISASLAREQLAAEIGALLTDEPRTLDESLHRCSSTLVKHLKADVVRIWHMDDRGVLLRSSPAAGRVARPLPVQTVRVGEYGIGRIAATAEPEVWADGIPELWPGSLTAAEEERLRGGAGHPLTKDGRVVGVVTMLLRDRPTDAQLDSLASITDELALAIEHSRAQNAHRRSEERYRQLVEATVEGIVMHDRSGIIDVNPSITRLTGYTAEELIGTPAVDYISPKYRDLVDHYVRTNYQEPYEAEIVHRSGRVFPVEIKGSEFIRDGRRVRVAAIRDITERKKAERTAALLIEERTARETEERTRRQAEFLLEATQILSSSFDTSTTLRQLAHLAVRSLADFCVVTLRDRDQSEPAVVVHGDPAKQVLLEQAVQQWREHWQDRHAFERVQASGEAFLMPNITSADLDNMARDAEHRRLLGELGTRSLMSAPISIGGELIGSIMLASSRPDRVYATEDLALAQELSRRAALAIQAARSYNQALAATRARDELLSVVAHDLRNPLNTIAMAGSFALELLQGAEHQAARRQLDIIDRTVEHMNRLIQDLLDASRVQAGQLVLERAPTKPESVIREAMDMLQPLATHAGVRLEVECSPELPAVTVDRQRMVQVLSNLVGNALKFTPEGGRIAIGVTLHAGALRFTVSDTGKGIPADQLPLIFGRFYQARADRRGLGLGLSIAKGIVEAHGGEIWAESTVGSGSTFGIDLPVR